MGCDRGGRVGVREVRVGRETGVRGEREWVLERRGSGV